MQQEEFSRGLEKALGSARLNDNRLPVSAVKELFGDIYNDEKHREILMAYFAAKSITVYDDGSDETQDDADAEKAVTSEFSFDPKDKRYLDDYLKELDKIEKLSDTEMEKLLLSVMEHDADAKSKLLEQYLSKAADLARTYAGQGLFMEDLIGEANLALTEAVMDIEDYIDAGSSIETMLSDVEGYLGERMMDAIEYIIREETGQKDKDNEMARRVNEVAESARSLSQDLGRKVSVSELADNTSLTEEEIREVMRILGRGTADIDILEEK